MNLTLPRGSARGAFDIDVSYRAFKVWQRNRDVFMHIWRAEMIWPIFEPLIVMLGLGLGLGKFVELESRSELHPVHHTGRHGGVPDVGHHR